MAILADLLSLTNSREFILLSLHYGDITSDGRYDTKSIDTTDTILSKMSIDTTNIIFRYRYHHVIYKMSISKACELVLA